MKYTFPELPYFILLSQALNVTLRVDATPTLAFNLGVSLRDFWGKLSKEHLKIAQTK